jgi:hypothetical protein
LLNWSKSVKLPHTLKNQTRVASVNQKLIKLKHQKVYSLKLKLQLTKQNLMKFNSSSAFISTLQLFFSKKQAIAEFKRKNILNYQSMPCFVKLKAILSDVAIIR